MASVRVSWTIVQTEFPEGTAPAASYTVHLGSLSATAALGTTQHVFADVAPGDYPSSVETVNAAGVALAMHVGPSVHVPTPVMVPVASTVQAALVAA